MEDDKTLSEEGLNQLRTIALRAPEGEWTFRREDIDAGYIQYQIHQMGSGGHLASTCESLFDNVTHARDTAVYLATFHPELVLRLIERADLLRYWEIGLPRPIKELLTAAQQRDLFKATLERYADDKNWGRMCVDYHKNHYVACEWIGAAKDAYEGPGLARNTLKKAEEMSDED